MDVTPQLLKDVEFRETCRGYDPDEVDDFLERVGVAIGQLQARLREASERGEAAEARANQLQNAPPVSSETDDTLRRTLLLAQRTADAAVAEAQEEANRKLAEAEERSERLIADAQEQHDRALRESETEVRRSIDETRDRLLQEIHALEQIRDALMGDVETLERHTDDQRQRLSATLGKLQTLVDDPSGLAPLDPPEVSGVVSPPDPAPDFAAPPAAAPAAASAPAFAPEPAETYRPPADDAFVPPADPPTPFPDDALAPPLESPATDVSAWEPDPAPSAEPQPLTSPDPFATLAPDRPVAPPSDTVIPPLAGRREDLAPVDEPADVFPQPPPPPPRPERGSGFGGLGGPAAEPAPNWPDPASDEGPPTQGMPAIGEDPGGDNPWMADLAREEKAQQAPPAPEEGDDALSEWYRSAPEEEPPQKSKRFGRKK